MKIDDFVNNIKSIAISGHIKPDGDCIGSVLALYNYLNRNYHDIHVDMFLEESSGKFVFLKNFEKINHEFDIDKAYDLMICLDCSTLERLGKAEKYFHSAGHTICLDHHVSNPGYADENYIFGDSSSACEVLFNFLDYNKLDKDTAKCLYTGMVTDTGVFKYSCTSPATMRAAADLMEFDLPVNEIIDECFYAKGWNENRIMGYGLEKSRLLYDGQVIYSFITLEEMDRYQVTSRELDSIVSQLRLTRGVRCSVFMYQTGNNEYKVSFRSGDDFDVNQVAQIFGGGGHIRAAGCSVTGRIDSCLEAILTEVKRAL